MTTSATVPTPDEIWQILERTASNQEKADKRQEKASREIAELRASQRETDRQMKETDRRIKKTEALFNTQWGKLMESLVEGDLRLILQQKGIDVLRIYKNIEQRGRGDDFEYDIIAANGQEVVVVEVKTTLRVADVREFIEDLPKFTTRMDYYQGKTVYGAVAWLQAHEKAAVYAEKQGLFVIRATGSSASIVNQEDFKPRAFT